MRWVLICALLVSTFAVADVITKKDGTEIIGRVISDADGIVTVATERDGKTVNIPIPRSVIASIATQPTSQPTTRQAGVAAANEGNRAKREAYLAEIEAKNLAAHSRMLEIKAAEAKAAADRLAKV